MGMCIRSDINMTRVGESIIIINSGLTRAEWELLLIMKRLSSPYKDNFP